MAEKNENIKSENRKSAHKEKNIHAGHRQRLLDEFRENGLDSFNDIRSLELLLGFSGTICDMNPVSHALLDRFKTLNGVFQASEEELKEVKGVGPRCAALIRLVPEICRKADLNDSRKRLRSLNSSDQAGSYIQTLIGSNRDESFLLLSLDARLRLIRSDTIQEGTVNRVNVDIRKVVETALSAKASSCIIAHNHPDGELSPSGEDIQVTDRLNDALRLVNIPLADHIIVSPEGVYSFKQNGLL